MTKPTSFLFSFLLLISLSGIFILSYSSNHDMENSNPVLVFLAGLLPLIFYHLSLQLHKGFLTQNKVDSVYFFGFLVTLATLGSSAYILSVEGAGAISIVGAQFALGLLVTGYGLWARITLQNKIGSESNLDDNLSNYIDKVSILNDEFHKTINLFNKLSSEAAQNVREAGASVISTIASDIKAPSSKISQNLMAFSEQIQSLNNLNLGAAGQAVSAFSSAVTSAAIATPKFNENINALSGELASIRENYLQLSAVIQKETQGILYFNETLNKLSSSAVSSSLVLDEFSKSVPVLSKFNSNDLENITVSIKSFFNALDESRIKVEKFQSTVSVNQADLVSSFADTKDSLSSQAKELNFASNELGSAMNSLAHSLSQVARKLTNNE
jgi:uncharacterized protein YukE